MKTIQDIWFENERIYMLCSDDKVYSQPLEAFPALKDATNKERKDFAIGKFRDDIRWESIDEDIHISSFFEVYKIDTTNEVAAIFRRFPLLNVSEVAKQIGIHKTLLSQYIYGVKTPSAERLQLIKDTLHNIGRELAVV